jgi:hypothetical protein
MRRIVVLVVIGAVALSAGGLLVRAMGARSSDGPARAGSAALDRRSEGSRTARTGTAARSAARPSEGSSWRPSEGSSGPPSQGSPAPVRSSRPCAPSSGGTDGTPATQLVDVRVGTHEGFDRVTFEFAPAEGASGPFGVPGYRIGGTDALTEDASGLPVPVDGTSFASVVFSGASGWDVDGRQTYGGPTDLRPGFATLSEVKETGDFERVLSWGMGMAGPSCWQVSVLRDPPRLVIDLPHVDATAR